MARTALPPATARRWPLLAPALLTLTLQAPGAAALPSPTSPPDAPAAGVRYATDTQAPPSRDPATPQGSVDVVGGPRLARRGVQVDVPAGTPRPPRVTATSWLVADLDSGEVLAASRAHTPLAPASTLKILTLLAVGTRLDPGTGYTATDEDAAIDGSKVGLVPGSRYTVDDLLHGLMLGSGNDTANALGTLVGGQRAATDLMNSEARRLRATDTVAVNTSGLDAPGQVSSAYDLALLARAALGDRRIRRIVGTTRYPFPAEGRSLGRRRDRFEIQNHNRLLRNYPGATGVKNGYTVAARGSFVGSASRDGRRYVVTVVRAEGITWHLARELLDWAFANGEAASPVGVLVDPLPEGGIPPSGNAREAGAYAAPRQASGGTEGRAGAGWPWENGRSAVPVGAAVVVGVLCGSAVTGVRRRRRRASSTPHAPHTVVKTSSYSSRGDRGYQASGPG